MKGESSGSGNGYGAIRVGNDQWGEGEQECEERAASAAFNAGRATAATMNAGQVAAMAMNVVQAAVVKRVVAAMMQGRQTAREEEREVFPRKARQESTNYHRHNRKYNL